MRQLVTPIQGSFNVIIQLYFDRMSSLAVDLGRQLCKISDKSGVGKGSLRPQGDVCCDNLPFHFI